jgi:hypothetical protein
LEHHPYHIPSNLASATNLQAFLSTAKRHKHFPKRTQLN